MKIRALKCPECGASLEIKDDLAVCYCMYCGTKLFVDDENIEVTINKNINIHKTVIRRTVDDAAIQEAKVKDRMDRRNWIAYFLALAIALAYPVYYFASDHIKEQQARRDGLVSVGGYDSLVGKNYKSVVAHFESAGFENILVIDLDNADGLFRKDGEVEQVTVAGDSTFFSDDYFSPESRVVITHH